MPQSTDRALYERLSTCRQLAEFGGRTEPGEHGGVLVKRGDHHIGLWSCRDSLYRLHDLSGRGPLFECDTVTAAHATTIALFDAINGAMPLGSTAIIALFRWPPATTATTRCNDRSCPV